MSDGELLTRASVWLAVVAYGVGAGLRLCARGEARWVWTFGCGFFVVHVMCAFGFYHQWSHAAAFGETARQTAELTGWRWGGGLYFNYLFAALWLGDVIRWWLAPQSLMRRPGWLDACWHAFALFMVFNGTIVFGRGPVRWLGALVCGSLAVLYWRRRCLA
jgi:hypothetical protein